jgi:hypothetical protein
MFIYGELLEANGWIFNSSPVFCTFKSVRHDAADILLKMALNTQIQSSLNL